MNTHLVRIAVILALILTSPLARAVVLLSNETMYAEDLTEAKARARDFAKLQNRQVEDVSLEKKAILDYKAVGIKDERQQNEARLAYIAERNRHPPSRREDELEAQWLKQQAAEERADDLLRAKYISTRHRIDSDINDQAYINPNAEYDLKAPPTGAETDYLKAHPVEIKKKQTAVAPDGELLAPGAKSFSSPPPGGASGL